MTPTSRLDDPGIGLRPPTTAAHLRDQERCSKTPTAEPGRTIELHLTGHMLAAAWSNGVKFFRRRAPALTYGERLRIVLVNDTMMTHPIHLHGMWSDIEDDEGKFHVRKHTVDMPRHETLVSRHCGCIGTLRITATFFFHMEAGMFREVRWKNDPPRHLRFASHRWPSARDRCSGVCAG